MSRVNLNDVVAHAPGDLESSSSELDELIDNYIIDKAKEREIKARTSEENNQIKAIYSDMKIKSHSTDNGTVKLSVETREKFREDDLIKYLKDNGVADGIVELKECVDFDALESAIYNEVISKDIIKGMDSCKDKTVVEKLIISKKKGD